MKLITERHLEHIEEYCLDFDLVDEPGSGYSFPCDKDGKPTLMNESAVQNFWKCMNKEHKVGAPHWRDISRDFMVDAVKQCDCGGGAYMSRGCGVFICDSCGEHEGLARCYCGWSLSGRSGYQELIEMGENIEEDY